MVDSKTSEQPDSDDSGAVRSEAPARKRRVLVVGGLIGLLAGVALYVGFFYRGGHASEVEAYLLGRAGDDLGAEQVRDAEPRRVWQVDLMQLEGFASISSASVDLDRDGQTDQSWTFLSDGRIRRERSTLDDGRFDVREERVGDAWIALPGDAEETTALPSELAAAIEGALEGEEGEVTAIDEAAIEESVRSEAEIWLLTQQGRELDVPLFADARPGESWRADLFQEDGATVITGAHLDLDRDGKVDQRWEYEGEDTVRRQIAAADDESFGPMQRWTDAGWE